MRLAYYGLHGHLMFTSNRPSWVCLAAFLHGILLLVKEFKAQVPQLTPQLARSLKQSRLEQTPVCEQVRGVLNEPDVRDQVERLSKRLHKMTFVF